ncbi:Cof-type HAD-IIB family hydrolase [Flaviflexus massiliensis]|uniref:Cof-type HAD-IIB family hydrolase n=1 Tax=Flaviflexus massiliensis TaxID=1522309 RepID=UPI0006D5B40B|nr:Cof-type HAD-IIB family hydrolase [Flaviflexus massiliensis]
MTEQMWDAIEANEHDVRLVVCDMDGTLLDDDGNIPEAFWPLLDKMLERGIVFAPASGRQLATLKKMFGHEDEIRTYISENGTFVMSDGEIVSITPIERADYIQSVDIIRNIDYRNAGVVVGGAKGAYAERKDQEFVDKIRTYNRALTLVDDLKNVDDQMLKMAIYDFDGISSRVLEDLAILPDTANVVLSGDRWIDIMSAAGNKGKAVADLQRALGVTPEQTVVFGDYLNDLEMMRRAHLSFAMENAHPTIRETARYIAPSNTKQGVLSVLSMLLDA